MAVTAKFVADFTSFDAAVKRAELELRAFESGANKVGPALNRMVDQFSGRKLIQEATMMSRVLGDAGSIARLTGNELQAAGAKAAEAAEKMKKLGLDVPPGLQRIADAAKSGEKAFGSFGQQVLATAAGFVTAQAILGAARGVIKALGASIRDLIMTGGDLSAIHQSFDVLARSVNTTGEAMLGTMRTGTRGLVADLDLMKAANKAVLLGLPATSAEMGQLAATATTLGRAMGQGATKSFDDLITALGRSSPMILDNLGLSVKVGEANEMYAAKIGKTAAALTDAEKKTAFYNAAMEAARTKVAELGDAHATLGDAIQQAGVWWANFNADLAVAIARSPVLNDAVATLGRSLGEAFGGNQDALIQNITKGIEAAAGAVVNLGLATIEMARVVHVAWSTVGTAVLGTITGIVKVAEATLATVAVVARVGEAFGQVQKGTSAWATATRQDLKGVSDSLADQTKEALRGVAGISALDKTFDEMGGVLFRVKDALNATRTETAAFVGPLRDLAAGQDAAGAAAGRHATLTKPLPAELAKAKAAAEQLAKAYAALQVDLLKIENVLPGITGSFGRVDDSVMKLGGHIRTLTKDLSELERHGWSTSGVMRQFAGDLEKLGAHVDPATIQAWADEWRFVGPLLEDAGKKTQTFGSALDALASSLGTLAQVSGDSFGGVVKAISQVVGAANVAVKAFESISTAASTMATNTASSIATMATGYGALISMGVQAGIAFTNMSADAKRASAALWDFQKAMIALMTEAQKMQVGTRSLFGRDRFDDAAAALIVVRDAYLAIGLSAQQAAADVDRFNRSRSGKDRAVIEENLQQYQELQDAVHAMGSFTQAELQAVADKSKRVFEFMERAGTYTAEQLAVAWDAFERDQAIALGQIPAVAGEAVEAVDELAARYKSLSDSVAKEAPEKVMGSVERATRAEMATLEKEMASKQHQLELDAKAAVDALEEALEAIDPKAVHVPIVWDIPKLPSGRVTMPETSGSTSGGGGTAVIEVDGRVLAEVTVPHISGVIERYGLFRR